jgi:hypothetical protein
VDNPRVIRVPFGRPEPTADLLEELIAAADLVASGAVRRIILSAFPDVEDVAAGALAYAQSIGVAFRLTRDDTGAVTVHIGPREE